MMRVIAEQYRYLLVEIKLLKADMETLDPKKHPAEVRSIICEIRNIRVLRIKKSIADCNSFKEWVECIPDDFIKKAMFFRYVKGYTWTEVAKELGGYNSPDGIKHLCQRYFTRDSRESSKSVEA